MASNYQYALALKVILVCFLERLVESARLVLVAPFVEELGEAIAQFAARDDDQA